VLIFFFLFSAIFFAHIMHIGSLFSINHTMLLYTKNLYTNLKNWNQVTSFKKHEGKFYIIVICQLTLKTKPNILTNLWCKHHWCVLVLLTLLNRRGTHGNPAWYGLLLLPLRNPLNNNLKVHHTKYINPQDLLHTKENDLYFESNHSIFLCLIPLYN